MRRVGVLFLLVASTLAIAPGRADAHICPGVVQIPVGTPASVTVYVRIEGTDIPDVQLDVPPELHLDKVEAPPGWTATRTGQTVRMHGPGFEHFTCPYFTIGVTASTKGAFQIPVTQRDASGTLVLRSSTDPAQKHGQNYAETVYAGVKPPSTSTGGGMSGITIAGIALIAIGVLAAAGFAWRSRRRGDDDDEGDDAALDEHRARVEAFRAQTRARAPRDSTPERQ